MPFYLSRKYTQVLCSMQCWSDLTNYIIHIYISYYLCVYNYVVAVKICYRPSSRPMLTRKSPPPAFTQCVVLQTITEGEDYSYTITWSTRISSSWVSATEIVTLLCGVRCKVQNSFHILIPRENVNFVCLSIQLVFFGLFVEVMNEAWMKDSNMIYGLQGCLNPRARQGRLLIQSSIYKGRRSSYRNVIWPKEIIHIWWDIDES